MLWFDAYIVSISPVDVLFLDRLLTKQVKGLMNRQRLLLDHYGDLREDMSVCSSGDLAHTFCTPRLVQSLTDLLNQRGAIGGLPRHLPSLLALASPARTRS